MTRNYRLYHRHTPDEDWEPLQNPQLEAQRQESIERNRREQARLLQASNTIGQCLLGR